MPPARILGILEYKQMLPKIEKMGEEEPLKSNYSRAFREGFVPLSYCHCKEEFLILFALQICTVESQGLECNSQQSRNLLIQGGTVVNADFQQQADVYIEDGIIKIVAPNLKVSRISLQ